MIFRVKSLREKAGMSQVQLSEKSGITRAVISKIEHNDSPKVNVTTLIALADALNCEPGDLFLPKLFSEKNTPQEKANDD